MARSVKHPTSAPVMISRFVSSSPASGSVLTAQSLEPASDSASPSLSAPPLLSLSLNSKQMLKKKYVLIGAHSVVLVFPTLGTLLSLFHKATKEDECHDVTKASLWVVCGPCLGDNRVPRSSFLGFFFAPVISGMHRKKPIAEFETSGKKN